MNRLFMIPTTSVANLLLSAFIMCTFPVKGEENGTLSLSAVLEEKLKNYDKTMTPTFGTGSPVMVELGIFVMDISSLNEETMDFSLTCSFLQIWKDPRLAGIDVPGWNREVGHDSEIIKRIWIPDTYFVKDKETVLRESTQPNSKVRISRFGTIARRVRMTTRTACSMDLRYFPMDTQKCIITIESYSYTAADVRYHWGERIGFAVDLQLMRYKFIGYLANREGFIMMPSGRNITGIDMTFFFKRDMGYYLINLYLPSALLVFLSCFSYWLGPHSMHSRRTLTYTCVLALTILIAGNDDALPSVSYVRAIDVYIIICFFLVLLALAQYVIIQHMSPPSCQHYYDTKQAANENEEQQISSFQLDASLLKTKESRATKADKYAKYAVPLIFCVINVLYWTIYLNTGGFNEEYTKYPIEHKF